MRSTGVRNREGFRGPAGITNVPGSRRGRCLDTVRGQEARDSYLEEAPRRSSSGKSSLWHSSSIDSAGDSVMAVGAKFVYVVEDR